MACKTLTDLIPTSYLGAESIQKLLDKFPQAQPPGLRTWQQTKVFKILLYLTNPANQAVIRQIVDMTKMGDLAGLVLLANVMQAMGMEGLVDMSKLSGVAGKVTDTLGCIAKNVQALQSTYSLVGETVTAVVAPSNIYKALGLSDFMAQSGITSSYLMTDLTKAIGGIPGISGLTQLPGVFQTIPLSYTATQGLQSMYTVNALAQTIQLLDAATGNSGASSAFTAVSAAGTMNGQNGQDLTTGQQYALAFSQRTAQTGDTVSSIYAIQGQQSTAEAIIQQGVANSVAQVPATVPAGPQTINGVPLSKTTVEGIAAQGVDKLGDTLDATQAANYENALEYERMAWRKRCLTILQARYAKEYTAARAKVNTSGQTSGAIPTQNVTQDDMVPMLAAVRLQNDSLLERLRVLDYKMKEVKLELDLISKNMDITKNAQVVLQDYATVLGNMGAVPHSSKNLSGIVPPSSCNFRPLPTKIGNVSVLLQSGVCPQVHQAVIDTLTSIVSKVPGLTSITISSGTRNYIPQGGSSNSWHLYGGAIDISQFNGVAVSSSNMLSKAFQAAASQAGAHENFGPFLNPERGTRPHNHISVVVPRTCDARKFQSVVPATETQVGE